MEDILTLGRSKELSRARASHMEAVLQTPIKTEPVNAVVKRRTTDKKKAPKQAPARRACYWCSGPFPHEGDCPAKGKRCTACGRQNHFARVCHSASPPKARPKAVVNNMAQPDSEDMDDDEPEGTVHNKYAAQMAGATRWKTPQCQVNVNQRPMKALIDTGASIH